MSSERPKTSTEVFEALHPEDAIKVKELMIKELLDSFPEEKMLEFTHNAKQGLENPADQTPGQHPDFDVYKSAYASYFFDEMLPNLIPEKVLSACEKLGIKV